MWTLVNIFSCCCCVYVVTDVSLKTLVNLSLCISGQFVKIDSNSIIIYLSPQNLYDQIIFKYTIYVLLKLPLCLHIHEVSSKTLKIDLPK